MTRRQNFLLWFLPVLLLLPAACSREAPLAVEVQTATQAEAAPAEAAAEKSVAVLPFADLSELGDQDYFSDGLSEYLIDRLGMLPDLQVATRDASFHYKDRNVVLSEVGTALGVTHILQGSVGVRAAGERR
jgi:adenylate cyclase